MNKEEKKALLKNCFGFNLDDDIFEQLELWEKYFIEYNQTTNLMSRKDVNFLFEKHVFDCLSVLKWDKFLSKKTILDVGCGGGFPSLIFAICFKDKKIIANDSRIKKINFVKNVKQKLNLKNLDIIYSRIEEVEPLNAELIVSRAVGRMSEVFGLSEKHLASGGNFLIYKAKTVQEEIRDFKKKYNCSDFKIIPYKLPLEENFVRNLIVI